MMKRILWTLLTIGTLSLSAQAQNIWIEQGDAGDLPETAQSTGSFNPLDQIRGTLDTNDVDMYAIYISDPATFSASTVGGATWDTQLFLFDADGKGVVAEDDTGGSQSTINNARGCIPRPGLYYLAITRYNKDPLGCDGGGIWSSNDNNCPNGTESTSRVSSWTTSSSAAGSYTIFLTGARSATAGDPADCPPSLPTSFTLIDGDAQFRATGIRGQRTTFAGGIGDYKSLGTGSDHLYQNWWWFRTDTDTREYALSNLTAFNQPQPKQVSLTYLEGALTFEITYELTDAGDNQAVVVVGITVTNGHSYPVTINLFNYSDFDIDGSAVGDNAELVRPGYIRAWETNTAHIFTSETPFAWQIGAFSGVRDLLTDSDTDDLNNSGSPFGPGDFTGAFQWQFSLNDGESKTILLALTINVEPPSCQPHNGDVTGEGCVDDADLLQVLFAFGQTGENLGRVDVNCDHVVDDADLLQVLFNFGSGC